jgi:hypothetical protein
LSKSRKNATRPCAIAETYQQDRSGADEPVVQTTPSSHWFADRPIGVKILSAVLVAAAAADGSRAIAERIGAVAVVTQRTTQDAGASQRELAELAGTANRLRDLVGAFRV